jgi:hypothetical protein
MVTKLISSLLKMVNPELYSKKADRFWKVSCWEPKRICLERKKFMFKERRRYSKAFKLEAFRVYEESEQCYIKSKTTWE